LGTTLAGLVNSLNPTSVDVKHWHLDGTGRAGLEAGSTFHRPGKSPMSILDPIIIYILYPVLGLLQFIVLVSIIMSWLINFNVINTGNQLVAMIWQISNAITEPLLGPIRRFVPVLGGMDFSALILLLLLRFVQMGLLPQLLGIL
jgi:YggT family protein